MILKVHKRLKQSQAKDKYEHQSARFHQFHNLQASQGFDSIARVKQTEDDYLHYVHQLTITDDKERHYDTKLQSGIECKLG